MRLEGKVALISGGARGQGAAEAKLFAGEGAKVVFGDILDDLGKQVEAEIHEVGGEALYIHLDVTNAADWASAVEAAVSRYGRLDVLVNNAGIGGPVGLLQDNDVTEWINTIQVNVVGTYLCCRAVLPVMIAQDRGKIVNLAGAGATAAWRNTSAYCASKAAVVRLTENIWLELDGKNVQINSLGPGSIDTRMWEQLRDGAELVGDKDLFELGVRVTSGGGASIERAADLAVFFASDDSGKLSGRLISAVADDFDNLPPRIPEIMASDAFIVRKVELD